MRFSQAPLQHLQADLGRLVAHADRAHLGQADFVICHLKKGRGFNLKEKKVGGLYVGHLREARGGGDFLSDFSLPGAPCTQASPARGLGDPTLAQCSFLGQDPAPPPPTCVSGEQRASRDRDAPSTGLGRTRRQQPSRLGTGVSGPEACPLGDLCKAPPSAPGTQAMSSRGSG